MFRTIFKYLWTLPIAVLYIRWTIRGVQQFILWTKLEKRAKAEAFWEHNCACFSTWVILHALILIGASFGAFLSDYIV